MLKYLLTVIRKKISVPTLSWVSTVWCTCTRVQMDVRVVYVSNTGFGGATINAIYFDNTYACIRRYQNVKYRYTARARKVLNWIQ